jgi:hypothetical protein
MQIDRAGPTSGTADWKMAVRAAAARLSEHLGSCDDPVAAALANDLAALLCAYGLVDEELARMKARDPAVDGSFLFGQTPFRLCRECQRIHDAELNRDGREIRERSPDYR